MKLDDLTIPKLKDLCRQHKVKGFSTLGKDALVKLIRKNVKGRVGMSDGAPVIKGKGDFTPHMMYDPKTGKGKKAKVESDHLAMKKKGFVHSKPGNVSGGGDLAVAQGTGDSKGEVSDRLRHLVDKLKGGSIQGEGRCWEGYKPTPGKKPYSKGSCMKGKGDDDEYDADTEKEDPIDWDDIKWGSFTEQLKRYNATHQKKFSGDKALCDFANMILSNKSKYSTTTKRRASFYLNVLAKKKCS